MRRIVLYTLTTLDGAVDGMQADLRRLGLAGLLVLGLIVGCDSGPIEPAPLPSGGEITSPPGPWTPPETGGTVGPTTPEESTPTARSGRHSLGGCGGVPGAIVGTEGDDVLRGTGKADTICGGSGNDVIVGGGGPDKLYGGPGDDVIRGGPVGDTIEGNDGHDVMHGGNTSLTSGYDLIWGDTHDLGRRYDDRGDDVLIGGNLSTGEKMSGGPGNDLLQPSPLRRFSNYVDGGDGKDVAVTLNFSYGPNADIVDLDGKPDTKIAGQATTNCKVTAQLSYDKEASPEGAVECDLPWPGRLSALNKVLPVEASIDTNGKLSMDMTLYQGIGRLSVSGQRNLVAWQASLGADACICDPLMKIPDDPKLPRDYPS